MTKLLVFLLHTGLVAPSSKAPAAPHENHSERHAHEENSPRSHFFEFSVGHAFLVGFEDGKSHAYSGIAATATFALIPHTLEVETVFHILASDPGLQMPIDLIFRKPWIVSSIVHPYFGLGPTIIPFVENGHWKLMGGLGVVGGADFWFTRTVGLFAEANVNMIRYHSFFPELGAVGGLNLGF